MIGKVENKSLRDVSAADWAPALGRSAVIKQREALLAETPLRLRRGRHRCRVIESKVEALRYMRTSARASAASRTVVKDGEAPGAETPIVLDIWFARF